jgi:hypothetical protein
MISTGIVPNRGIPKARQRVTVSGSCEPSVSNFRFHSAKRFA